MTDPTAAGQSATADHPVPAVLEGGPADLSEATRHLLVAATQSKVKVRHLGGYEHFERDPATAQADVVTYRWVTRTKIAE